MPEQPFRDQDTLYRYTPPGLGEVVFAKADPSNVYGVVMYYHIRRQWVCTMPGMRDVVELLRQLAATKENASAKDDQIRQLENECRRLQEQLSAKAQECLCREKQASGLADELLAAQTEIATLKALLRKYVDAAGPVHEPDCPQDDTCSCKGKPLNDRINEVLK